MSSNRKLAIWSEDVRIGELVVERGGWSLAYAADWPTRDSCFPLSPWFPVGESGQIDQGDDRRVEWYFDNMLPEGGVRVALAAFADLDARDTFGLLRRFGEESAGALTLVPSSAAPRPPSADDYAALTNDDLRALIAGLPRVPLLAAQGRAKMSLAGAQHKLGLRLAGNRFFLPSGASASSHILKPDNARPEHYPFCPANEHFVMSLARAIGIPVPATRLLHLPEPVYVIDRYDRALRGGVVRRRHQIDLCQMLNRWPSFKYEADGGATLVDLFAAAELVRQPAAAKAELLRWVVFNYVVGNSDAHAKNVSFLVGHDGFDLGPFYDLLSVRAYGDDSLAMTIGGEDRYGLVTAASWDALADMVGLRPAMVRRVRQEIARDLVRAAPKVLGAAREYTAEERTFLEERVLAIVREHAAFVMEGV